VRRKRQLSAEPTVQLSHKIALIPEPKQAIYFGMACGTARFTWNWALAECNQQVDAGLKPNAASLKKAFNAVTYTEFPWLADIHRDAPAEPFNHLGRAWAKCFKDCKEGKPAYAPVFKKKGKCRESFYVANDKCKVNGQDITLPLVGRVTMGEELRFRGKVIGATVSRSAPRWFVAIQGEIPERLGKRKRTGNGSEGVDLGITSAVTLATGEKIQAPKPLTGMLRRLRIRTRRVSGKLEAAKVKAGIEQGSRIPKGAGLPVSNNRKKASAALARLHSRITNTRKDFLHKGTTRLCRENQAVGLEDLNVAGMMQNDRLARAISDIGMGEFARQMAYKAKRYDTNRIEADRWFPSSKKCSVCGFVHIQLKRSDRVWTCLNCGTVHDRDTNAGENLNQLAPETALPVASSAVMQTALAEPSAAYGGKVTPVRHDIRSQRGSGQEEKEAVSVTSCDHICAPFR